MAGPVRGCGGALWLGVLGILALSQAVGAEEETLVIGPPLRAGERFTLEIRKTRAGGGPASAALVDATVTKAGAEGHVLSWSMRDYTPLDLIEKGAAKADTDAVTQAYRGLAFEIDVTPEGHPRGLRNYAQLKPQLEKVASALGRASGKTEEERARSEKMLRDTLFSQPGAEALATKDLDAYFALAGKKLGRLESQEYAGEFPSPLGGKMLPTRNSLRITAWDAKTNLATVKASMQLTEEAADAFGRDLMTRMSGRAWPADARAPKVDVRCEYRAVVEARTGWINQLTYSLTFDYPGRPVSGTMEIVRKVAGAASQPGK